MRLQEFVEDEVFSPTLIAGALWTTKSEIASTLGLGQDALSRAARVPARTTQTRLREMMEILHRVEAHTGCATLVAYAWFRSEPLPGLDAMTPTNWYAGDGRTTSMPTSTRSLPVGTPEIPRVVWRTVMYRGEVPASHALANRLIRDGYVGMLVRSFAAGAGLDDRNLVLRTWGDRLPSRVALIGDEQRLP